LISLDEPAIISLGGGAIIRLQNRICIRGLGKTVWLQAEPETIVERIANDSATHARRPKLSTLGELDEIRTILQLRLPWYKEVSDFAVSTDGLTMEQVAETILKWFQCIT